MYRISRHQNLFVELVESLPPFPHGVDWDFADDPSQLVQVNTFEDSPMRKERVALVDSTFI
jgi:hypothetical protein